VAKKWTKEEEKFIEENWKSLSDAEIAKEIDRTKNAIRNRRNKLGIKRPRSHSGKFNQGTHWTTEKTEFLRKNYQEMDYSEIAKELNVTIKAVRSKVSKLDLKNKQDKWSNNETEFLRKNYGLNSDMTARQIANELDRSLDSVQNKIKLENLSYVEQKSFSDKEVEYLKNNYKTKTHKELADELNRNKSSITQHLNRLNLYKTPTYSEQEKKFIKENWKSLSDHEMADEINRSVVSLRKKRRSLGLKRSSFVNTEEHWTWEEACEKAAKEIYNNVETQKVMEGLRPDIFVPEKNLVIDAKTSCYRGLNDLKKYKNLDQVDKVVVWSMRPVKNANNRFEVFDINDLNNMVSFDIEQELEDKCKVNQTSIKEIC